MVNTKIDYDGHAFKYNSDGAIIIAIRPGRIRKSRKEKYKTMDTAGQPVKAKIERSDKHQTGESVRYGCAVVHAGRTARKTGASRVRFPPAQFPGPMPGSFQGMAFCCGSNA